MAFSDLGRFIFVENEEKLAQDCEKITVTVIGSNYHHQWYGTNLMSFLGSSADPNFFRIQISSDITKAIRKLIDLQSKQRSYQSDYMSNKELVGSVDYLDVAVHEFDPTRMNAKVGIVSKSSTLVEINRTFRF
jgi:hypothetical protein